MAAFDSPYARTLGLVRDGTTVTMASHDGLLGRPGFIHGGALSGLLDYAAWVTLADALDEGVRMKPVSVGIDFLRGGRLEPTHASATITRLGRRITNVVATAWQDDPAKPIATANVKFIIER